MRGFIYAMGSSAALPYRKPGTCRFCRCTDARACPGGCAWHDNQRTVCDNPDCVKALEEALKEIAKTAKGPTR